MKAGSLVLLLSFVSPSPIMSFASNGMRSGYGGQSGYGSVNGYTGYLPPGYSMLDGELVDMSNKMVQRIGGSGGGTQYFSWTDQRGPPVFRRREIDTGRRFIVFPDRNYPPGDGHYVVLRRFQHGKNTRRGGTIYEAFFLDLGDSINAMVTNFNSLAPAPPGLLGNTMSTGGRRMLTAGGLRVKRQTERNYNQLKNLEFAEMVILRKLTQLRPIKTKIETSRDKKVEEGVPTVVVGDLYSRQTKPLA